MELSKIKERLDSHKKAALSFSGGKDSLATLYYLRPFWGRFDVVWLDTQDTFPEIYGQMARVADLIGDRFVRVQSNAPAQIEANGIPTDVVPIWDTPLGKTVDTMRGDKPKFQATLGCCFENLYVPLHNHMVDNGVTLIIRGQRHEEVLKSPIMSGHMDGDLEYLHPIEDWSRARVIGFLESQGVEIPRNYREGVDNSLDCMHCTGYLHERADEMDYVRRHYPLVYEEQQRRLGVIHKAVSEELAAMRNLMEVENERSL